MPSKSNKIWPQQWRDRLKTDPDAHQRYLKSEREWYLRQKESGSKKLVKDLTSRQHRRQKRAWEKQQRNHRKSVKEAPNTLTQPGSPDNDVPIVNRAMPPESSELKMKSGRPKVRYDRAKAYRTKGFKLKYKLHTVH